MRHPVHPHEIVARAAGERTTTAPEGVFHRGARTQGARPSADAAQHATDALTERLARSGLAPAALELYRLLHATALRVAALRRYSPGVTQVSYHAPAEIVALAAGHSTSTVYRALEQLQARGLVAARGHYTTLRGATRSDGTVWTVRLVPQRGKRARVSYEDLRHKWRDLAADIEAGRTAWAAMGESRPAKERPVNAELLLTWAMPPRERPAPLRMTLPRRGAQIESVLDVGAVPRAARRRAVDDAAGSCAAAMRDPDGFRLYAWLLWQALRTRDAGGRDWLPALYDALARARADALEGFARRPGALLVARLKASGVWDALAGAPPRRVAA